MRKTTITKVTLALIAALAIAFSQVACGKDSVEKSVTKVVRAVKAARQVTTEQHEYGHITDAQYVQRLKIFKSAYIASDALADELVKYEAITDANRADVLRLLREFNAKVNELIQTGDFGVKNPQSKAEFARYSLLASGTLSAIEVVVASATKPIETRDAKIQRLEE